MICSIEFFEQNFSFNRKITLLHFSMIQLIQMDLGVRVSGEAAEKRSCLMLLVAGKT